MAAELVAPGIYAVSGLKVGRAYIVDDADGLTLVDTSSPGASDGLLRAIASIGRRPEDVRTIVATHYHDDHTGNVASLRDRSGATLCAHADDAPYIDGRTPWRGLKAGGLQRFMTPDHFTLTVDRALQSGDRIDAAGGMEVVHAPGHTPGSIALLLRERGVLFAGDAFMNVMGLRLAPAMSTHDVAEARRTVKRLAGMEFDVALPGHGAPVVGRASEKLAALARRM
jgi:glyoxylase-like metal-dependent hydrolase (beta-lactamase superfamily II)